MTEKIARRGVKTPHLFKPDVLEKLTVNQIKLNNQIALNVDDNVRIKDAREWLSNGQNYRSNYFIVTNIDGIYKGILSYSNLFNKHHNPEDAIATIIKQDDIYVNLNDTLLTAVETMAKEDIDILPVLSNENNTIMGILSYRDIIATYKHGINEHEINKPHISLKFNHLKIFTKKKKPLTDIKR